MTCHKEEAIFRAIAWSKYIDLKGVASADPSDSGIDDPAFSELKSCLSQTDQIKSEVFGDVWFEFDKRLSLDSPLRDSIGRVPFNYINDWLAIAHSFNIDLSPEGMTRPDFIEWVRLVDEECLKAFNVKAFTTVGSIKIREGTNR